MTHHRAVTALGLIGILTVLAIFSVVSNAAAEDVAPSGRAQQVQAGNESGRPAAPRLLSVEIIPDRLGSSAVLQIGKEGARPAGALKPNEPVRVNSDAAR